MHAQGTALPTRQGTAGQGRAGESRRIAYTVGEVAKLLGKHVNTIYGWVGSGALPSRRIGGTIYIPKWALASLVAPDADDEAAEAQAASGGGEAA